VAEALEAAAALSLASAPAEPVAAALGVPAEPGPPTVVVAGSLYLVAEARALLLGEAPEAFERWQ
ncbi:MAG: bifunctional folylpolyglutamate synthase/dihydrofolate synthase, partial [Trueperaceae bacterium]|nr:bifunctional folylpolyglutamate synthase/dihydrofolate synthase [Trueperaceae bacterium]